VSELREYFDEVVESEMKRREHELDGLSDAQREAVRLDASIDRRQDRAPSDGGAEGRGRHRPGIRLTEATRTLFDL
jgi:hypothetical protein